MGIWGGTVQHDHGSINQGGQVTACDSTLLYPSNFSTTSVVPVEIPGSSAVLNVSLNRRIFAFFVGIVQRTAGAVPGGSNVILYIETSPGAVFVDNSIGASASFTALNLASNCSFSCCSPVLVGNQAYRAAMMFSNTAGTNLVSGMQVAYLEHPSG